MSETRARRKIREAVERHDMRVDSVEWEPIGGMVEMSGREGGWVVFVKDRGVLTGYSWQDVVEAIDLKAPMWLDGSLIG